MNRTPNEADIEAMLYVTPEPFVFITPFAGAAGRPSVLTGPRPPPGMPTAKSYADRCPHP